jgi:tetratricopeptide (TPR) repeat protein/predicted Ser/Thr protein kinase
MTHDPPGAPEAPPTGAEDDTLPAPPSRAGTRVGGWASGVDAGGEGADAGPQRGTTVGRFLLLERLGQGGMGVVYSAYDDRLDRRVAIKLLRPEAWGRDSGSQGRERLLREAQAMARLSHPNVVTVYEVGAYEAQLFVAMEYVEGQTLGQWLRERPRPPREVLPVLLAAGRGLAAAHAKGLVHRDFKPDNVLVGADGRVRVSDFGLVRQSGEEGPVAAATPPPARTSTPTPAPAALTPARTPSGGEATLTHTGTVMGTPGYMAPEQSRGARVDAQADQYAFCATLHVALYGRLPRAGVATVPEGRGARVPPLRRAPERGPASGLPPRLRAALERGLSVEPSARFPSMEALLAELEAAAAPRRHAAAWGGAAALLVLLALGLAWRAQRTADAGVCRGAEAQLAGVWDAGVARAVAQALGRADGRLGEAGAARVVARLEGHARAWVSMHTEACEATAVRHTQSPALLDLRMACLERRRTALRATTRLLVSSPDAAMALRAPEMVRELEDLSECADLERLQAAYPLPREAAAREALAVLRERLEEARALRRAGDFVRGQPVTTALLERARALGHPPMLAEALLALGQLHNLREDGKAAEAPLHEAVAVAAQVKDAALEAQAWTGLCAALAVQARHAESELAGRAAQAALARAGNPFVPRVNLLGQLAELASKRGLTAVAEARFGEVAALVEAQPAEDAQSREYLLAVLLANHGGHLSVLGRTEEARRQLARAQALFERTTGPDHRIRSLLLFHQAQLARSEERASEEAALLAQVLRIQERVLAAPDAWGFVQVLRLAVGAQAQQGRFGEARGLLTRALAIQRAHHGELHPEFAGSLHAQGELHLLEGKPAQARADFARAREVFLQLGHPGAAQAREGLGRALLAQGRFEEARAELERAAAESTAAEGEASLPVAHARVGLGEALLALGQAEAARAHLSWAVERLEGMAAVPSLQGRARLGLARALWAEPSERPRALALAGEALEGLGRVETVPARALLAEGRAWLASAGGPAPAPAPAPATRERGAVTSGAP